MKVSQPSLPAGKIDGGAGRRALGLLLAMTAMLASACGGAVKPDGTPRLTRTAAKIHVEQPGVYRVTGQDLVKGGLDLADFDPKTMTLVYTGKPVPILVEDGGDGKFDPADSILFHAEGTLHEEIPFINMVADYEPQTQIFMLFADGDAPRFETVQMDTPAEPSGDYPLISVGGRYHFEDNPIWKFYEDINRSQDKTNYLYWKELTYPPTTQSESAWDLVIDLPQADTSHTLKLITQLIGITQEEWGQFNQKHRMKIKLNDTHEELLEWEIGTRTRSEVNFPAGSYRAAQNKIVFEVLPTGGEVGAGRIALDDVLLDWFAIEFVQKTRLFNNKNEFLIPARVADAVPLQFSIQDFSGSDALLLDLTGARHLVAKPFEQDAANFKFGVNVRLDDATSGTRLVALSRRQLLAPRSIGKAVVRDNFEHPDDSEFLILTHPDFKKDIERLAEWKRGRGIKTSVVDVVELFDEKGGGYASPEVLRDYIRHVYESQPEPALKYVLLVGDSTTISKYKTYLPAYSYLQSGTHANDNFFGSFEGPYALPEVAVGRFSVRTGDQLKNAIDKVIAYEKGEGSGDWRNRVLLIAASLSWAESDAEQLAQMHFRPRFEIEMLKTDKNTTVTNYVEFLNNRLLELFNEGNLISVFLGHGGGTVWQVGPGRVEANFEEKLFEQSNVESLQNGRRLPLVLALTCYTNDFDNAYVAQTLGETFINSAGGAIAILGAAQRTYTHTNQEYCNHLFRVFAEGKLTRLGDQINEAKRRMNQADVNSAYLLLGDPTLEFQLPQPSIELTEVAPQPDGTISGRMKLPDGVKLPATLSWRAFSSDYRLIGEGDIEATSAIQQFRFPLSLTPPASQSMMVSLTFYLNQGSGRDFNGGITLQ